MFEGAIKGSLGILGKTTTGQLPHLEVIGNTPAADPLLRAGVIGTVTPFQVFFLLTFH